MAIGILFGVLAVLASHAMNRWSRSLVYATCGLIVITIAYSRIYLGVHWPTDVLAGWALGAAWALLCWMVARWLRPQDHETEAART